MTLALGLPGYAQTVQAPPVIAGPPDVLAIVYQQPGAADQVDITYAHTVPRAQALEDCRVLTQAAGWPVSTQVVKDAAAPMESRSGPMTSVVFQALGVVQPAHPLPIGLFAQAFHHYRRLKVVFFTEPQFQFQGARLYADNNIKMALVQNGTSYTYDVEILNPNSAVPPLDASVPPGAGHHSPWAVFWVILGAAALAGLAVYFLTARLTPKAKTDTRADQNTDQEAESRMEVGTKG